MKSINNLSLVKTIIEHLMRTVCYVGQSYSFAFVVAS